MQHEANPSEQMNIHFASSAGNGLAPMALLFQFLNLLRQEGPQKWVFDELANIAQMRFRFAEEEDACEYALRLAADAPYYAPEHLLNGHYLHDRWDPKLVICLLRLWGLPFAFC